MSQHIYYNAISCAHQSEWTKLNALWERFHDWEAAWHSIKSGFRIDPETEWERLIKRDIRLILRNDTPYPSLLREIARAPHGLYVAGHIPSEKPAVAVVGTRRATNEGLTTTRGITEGLARNGITVISGLAFGVDEAAHRGALASGAPAATIAVLPAGLDDIYPKSHANLAVAILENGGALISEYSLGSPPFPARFLERNRIVAGISRGTIVIEAPLKSGALVTARLALDANRDVLAVPGPVHHPNYAGPHKLIQDGAALITSAEDACTVLGLAFQKTEHLEAETKNPLSPEEETVLSVVKNAGAPLTIDTIAERSTLEIHSISRAIALLCVRGRLNEINGRYCL